MNDTGLPAPFIDITMLSPACADLPDPGLGGRLGRLDHGVGKAEIGHQLAEAAAAGCAASSGSSPANSTSSRASGAPRTKRSISGR